MHTNTLNSRPDSPVDFSFACSRRLFLSQRHFSTQTSNPQVRRPAVYRTGELIERADMRAANHSDIITPFPVALTTPHKGQNLKSALLRAYNKMRNGRVARDLGLLQGARRETALRFSAQLNLGNPNCRSWKPISFMDLRPTSNAAAAPKIGQPGGLFSGGRLAALLLSQRALRLSSFVAPCQPPARKQRAHSSF